MHNYRKFPGTLDETMEIHKQQSVKQLVMKNMFPLNFSNLIGSQQYAKWTSMWQKYKWECG